MRIRIRNAAISDVSVVTEIYRESVLNGIGTYELEPPSEIEMTSRFNAVTGQNYPYLIAEDENGSILGYAYASPFRTRPAYRYLAENSVYVSPEARGMGVGLTLLEALLSRTAELGIRQMVAVIGGANPASIALHEKAGFKHTGRMPSTGFKFGKWVDTVLMQIELGEGADTIPTEEPKLRRR
ncbi:N-acetyltransferase [Rhizobium sp. KVB221]|uniref:N-acetyltransferase n=1 Tax=Rhizobium setariae TaxID=2801340 RepID=A0A937CQ66_9HYPH|nr:GNAT family N-acetyltransferase [Rhizobium setariae]MBL0374049.1 N-acetyltransferase [Rhizobium setariae]